MSNAVSLANLFTTKEMKNLKIMAKEEGNSKKVDFQEILEGMGLSKKDLKTLSSSGNKEKDKSKLTKLKVNIEEMMNLVKGYLNGKDKKSTDVKEKDLNLKIEKIKLNLEKIKDEIKGFPKLKKNFNNLKKNLNYVLEKLNSSELKIEEKKVFKVLETFEKELDKINEELKLDRLKKDINYVLNSLNIKENISVDLDINGESEKLKEIFENNLSAKTINMNEIKEVLGKLNIKLEKAISEKQEDSKVDLGKSDNAFLKSSRITKDSENTRLKAFKNQIFRDNEFEIPEHILDKLSESDIEKLNQFMNDISLEELEGLLQNFLQGKKSSEIPGETLGNINNLEKLNSNINAMIELEENLNESQIRELKEMLDSKLNEKSEGPSNELKNRNLLGKVMEKSQIIKEEFSTGLLKEKLKLSETQIKQIEDILESKRKNPIQETPKEEKVSEIIRELKGDLKGELNEELKLSETQTKQIEEKIEEILNSKGNEFKHERIQENPKEEKTLEIIKEIKTEVKNEIKKELKLSETQTKQIEEKIEGKIEEILNSKGNEFKHERIQETPKEEKTLEIKKEIKAEVKNEIKKESKLSETQTKQIEEKIEGKIEEILNSKGNEFKHERIQETPKEEKTSEIIKELKEELELSETQIKKIKKIFNLEDTKQTGKTSELKLKEYINKEGLSDILNELENIPEEKYSKDHLLKELSQKLNLSEKEKVTLRKYVDIEKIEDNTSKKTEIKSKKEKILERIENLLADNSDNDELKDLKSSLKKRTFEKEKNDITKHDLKSSMSLLEKQIKILEENYAEFKLPNEIKEQLTKEEQNILKEMKTSQIQSAKTVLESLSGNIKKSLNSHVILEELNSNKFKGNLDGENSKKPKEDSENIKNDASFLNNLSTKSSTKANQTISKIKTIVDPHEVMDQINDKIKINFNKNTNKMKITLSPASLGEVEIEIKLKDGQLKAEFMVEDEKIKKIVESNLSNLKNELNKKGVEVSELKVGIFNQQQKREKPKSNIMKFIEKQKITEDDFNNAENNTSVRALEDPGINGLNILA